MMAKKITRSIPALESKEARRRKRERIIIVLVCIFIVALSFIESHLFRKEALLPLSNNVLIFGLININIILILLLIFLIVRNVVKLVMDRRKRIVGSKLRTKLVAAFVGLSLIPTAMLFIISINFLSYSIDNWFSIKIGDALNKTLHLAQTYYQQTSERAKDYAKQISGDITKNRLYDRERLSYLRSLIEQRQKSYGISMLEVYFDHQRERLIVQDPNFTTVTPITLTAKVLEDLYSGSDMSLVHSTDKGELIIGLAPIRSYLSPTEVLGIVVVSYHIPRELVEDTAVISNTAEQYRQFRLLKSPIKFSYIITLAIVTLLIIFSATWFGLYLAKGITEPIQDLADATRIIAQGNLEHQINIHASEEIGVLVDSFNQMTRDLKNSNQRLEQAYNNLESRRRYMEAVLRNVSAGIISVDHNGFITTINRAAEKMLQIEVDKVLNQRYEEVLAADHRSLADELLREMQDNDEGFIEKQVELVLKEKVLTALMTTTLVRDEFNNTIGLVIVFEDLTQLQRAERAAAWREVARRIAHEIKNPLTPVQLSAQRLQRKYGEQMGGEGSVFQECTKTIISQVEVLKSLVDEFSRYARLPVTQLGMNDLNETIHDSIVLFRDAHKDLSFQFYRDEALPRLNLDPEQIKRVMINLLDNAVSAVDLNKGAIEIRTLYDPSHHRARVEVADNGRGVPMRYKVKMFEPYFSTKSSGTGLGLAIVSSIIADHHGHISVRDNKPQGAVITFELPVPEA